MSQNISFSIYIPRIASRFSVFEIDETISNVLGSVHYVDIVKIGQNPGFSQTTFDKDTAYFAAFVHIGDLKQTDAANNIFYNFLERGEPYMHYVNYNEYWIILKNLQPIPRTFMNIHQVTDNCRRLEELVEGLESQVEELSDQRNLQDEVIYMQRRSIASLEKVVQNQAQQISENRESLYQVTDNRRQLEEKVKELSDKCSARDDAIVSLEQVLQNQSQQIARIQGVIYQLLGETFDQRTQYDIICQNYNFMMHDKHYEKAILNKDGTEPVYEESCDEECYEDVCDEECYEDVREEEEREEEEEQDEDVDSSTHSSMPSLVSISSDDKECDYEKSPITIPVTERIRNTAELCGNN